VGITTDTPNMIQLKLSRKSKIKKTSI